jgi:4-amino-4-deoxy-L-arabinose transferase-like glycosyltransferase
VFGGRRAGLAAFCFMLACPFVVTTVFRAYITLAVAFYAAVTLLAFARFTLKSDRPDSARWPLLAGLCAGLGVAVKYTAVPFLCAPVGLGVLGVCVLRRIPVRRTVLLGALFGLAALAAAGPWLVKNAACTGNPVYPLAYNVFGGTHWSPAQNAKWTNRHSPGPIRPGAAARRLWRFLTAGPRTGETGPYEGEFTAGAAVLFIPLLLLSAVRRDDPEAHPLPRAALRAAALAGGFFLLYAVLWYLLTHRIDRFLAPAVPALCVLSALGFEAARRRPKLRLAVEILAVLALIHAVFFQASVAARAGALTVPFGAESEEQYFAAIGFAPHTNAMKAIEEQVGSRDRILFIGEAQTYYCTRPVVAPVVFNHHPLSAVFRETPGPDSAVRALRKAGYTHILVNWSELGRLANSYAYTFEGRRIPGYLAEIDHRTGRPLTDLLARLRRVYPDAPGRAQYEIYQLP